MDWHLTAGRTRPFLCLSPYQHITFRNMESTHDWVRERIDSPSCGTAHKPKSVWKGKNNEYHIYAEPVPACWQMHLSLQHCRKKKLEPGMKTSLPTFPCHSHTSLSGAGEHISSSSLQGYSSEHGCSRAESVQLHVKFVKLNSAKEALLCQSYHPKPAGPVTKCMNSPYVSFINRMQVYARCGKNLMGLIYKPEGENCTGGGQQPGHPTILAHIIFFSI